MTMLYPESEDKRVWNNQVRSIRYRFCTGDLSPTRHLANPYGKPLCGAWNSIGTGIFEYVPDDVTCEFCEKQSRLR